MEKYKAHNLILQIISIFTAIAVWFLIMGIVKPIIDDSVTETIVVKNMDVFLEQGKSFEINGSKKVVISYDVRTDQASKINASHFTAYVDANEYSFTGSLPIHWTVSQDVEKLITNVRIQPQVVNVSSETLTSKNFYVRAKTTGTLSDGKVVGAIITNPTTVYVNGPSQDLQQVQSIGIEIDVNNKNSNFSGETKLNLYDSKGKVINNDVLYTSIENISYTVMIHESKEVSFNVLVKGDVKDGYVYDNLVISPQSVYISGPRNIINNIYSIDIPEISLDELTENIQFEYNIVDLLPQGVLLADDNDKVIVTVMVREYEENYHGERRPESKIIESKIKGQSDIIYSPKKNAEEEN